MQISPPYSNKSVNDALVCRSKVVKKSLQHKADKIKIKKICPYDLSVEIVCKITQPQKLLKSTEKHEIKAKYENGMTMAAIASLYGCHYTTVGRILKNEE